MPCANRKAALLKAVRPLMRRMSFVANMQAISRCPASNPARPSRHSSQPSCSSIRGDGPACRFIFGLARRSP